jgi:hypothetical protein
MTENLTNSVSERQSKGQIIILVALIFIGLIVFVGLVVDVGMVLAGYAQLRRTVDAAGVQASNQFREFRKLYNGGAGDDMFTAAMQVAAAQGFIPPAGQIRVFACTGPGPSVESSPSIGDPDPLGLTQQLCTNPPRKLVRVDGKVDIGLPFLSLVGWKSLTLRATSVAEAASIDLALVLDRSSSMTFDGAISDPVVCNATPGAGTPTSCFPFEDVRSNAYNLVNKLYFPYDRVAIVTFSRRVLVYDTATHNFRQLASSNDLLSSTFMISSKSEALSALSDNARFNIDTCVRTHGCYDNDMPGLAYTANTNTGGALRIATSVLAVQARTRGSVWMMLLLSDGAPNATDPFGQFTGGFCPPSTWSYGAAYTVAGYLPSPMTSTVPYAYPYCRRANAAAGGPPDFLYSWLTRACLYVPAFPGGPLPKCAPGTTITDTTGLRYDAADYMRDEADYMASNGVVAFVIGLGQEVSASDRNQSTQTWDPFSREANAGERLLRYVADVGTQPNAWLCHSDYWTFGQTEIVNTTSDHHCGNYWYAATGSGLQPIFDAIANRIFTRITQ